MNIINDSNLGPNSITVAEYQFQVQFLPQADLVVVMRGGRISHLGTYKELTASGVDFHQMKLADHQVRSWSAGQINRSAAGAGQSVAAVTTVSDIRGVGWGWGGGNVCEILQRFVDSASCQAPLLADISEKGVVRQCSIPHSRDLPHVSVNPHRRLECTQAWL